MKLIDLDPRWLVKDGVRVGFIFKSPKKSAWYQSCCLASLSWRDQRDLFNATLADLQTAEGKQVEYGYTRVQGCSADAHGSFVWSCSPPIADATFENITVTPSIDGSAGGLWHGFITNGEIVGDY